MAAMVHAINNSKVVNKVDVNFQQLVYITYNISQLFNEKRKTSKLQEQLQLETPDKIRTPSSQACVTDSCVCVGIMKFPSSQSLEIIQDY